MSKLNVYCCTIAGRHEDMVAATSRKGAAALLKLSVYELTTYGFDANDEEQEIALSAPGTVFRREDAISGTGEWTKLEAKS